MRKEKKILIFIFFISSSSSYGSGGHNYQGNDYQYSYNYKSEVFCISFLSFFYFTLLTHLQGKWLDALDIHCHNHFRHL